MANVSPEEALKLLEKMSIDEIKDAIIQTFRRQGRAEADLKYYKESYTAVIKEEKETRLALLGRLELLMESDRIRAVRDNWLDRQSLARQVTESMEKHADEVADAEGVLPDQPPKERGFLRAVEAGDAGQEP